MSVTWQDVAVVVTVVAALAYIIWKIGFASRPKKPKGPDVRARDLVRKSRGGTHSGERSKKPAAARRTPPD